ncbi:helix-turn-helix domain-containing protein [uncultured Butyricimonas sp.]|uniref:helix-turn-helix domain-containing protein n=1 Tax=uncultured Butyricimonas sp. TaxID=1268785 RepID=UPI0026DD7189|nr:helix-turn-helix domain-containing protein [uncultured Butyricimonas sp.]
MKTTLNIYTTEKVKQIRKEKKFTREQVDIQLSFSSGANYISHIENGTDKSYNLYHSNELAKIFNCDIANFFPPPQEANSLLGISRY